MNYHGFDVYDKSVNAVGAGEVFLAKDGGGAVLVASKKLGFDGKDAGGGLVKAPLSHKNACRLRQLLPFTAPSPVLRRERSFGVGDRLGIAVYGHIKLFSHYDACPVFAQQSIRELDLTMRSYGDVLDAVTFAVFREGFKKPWGADGDHLKTVKDVEYALSLGFSMITLDCSDHIKSGVTASNAPPAHKKYVDKYLGKTFDVGEGNSVTFDEAELRKCAAVYSEAIGFAADIWNRFFASGEYNADFEISIDETAEPTTPLQHFFVARELLDADVKPATIAPRFCGDFQKGIDYIGDLAQFDREIKIHAALSRHFGYKLSIHSGSDKFSVFPSIARETKGVFHVKTAGTNWLEAMRVVAQTDPALYREVHKYALQAFNAASAYYHVTTDLSRVPNIDDLSDGDLPGIFEQNDARQLIHITYGQILDRYREPLYRLWAGHAGDYAAALERHIGRHLALLGVGKA